MFAIETGVAALKTYIYMYTYIYIYIYEPTCWKLCAADALEAPVRPRVLDDSFFVVVAVVCLMPV